LYLNSSAPIGDLAVEVANRHVPMKIR